MAANYLHRSQLIAATREWFAAHDFMEAPTPVLTPYPETSPHLEPFRVEGGGQAFYLATSPEYGMKQVLGADMPRVYQISHFFRAGEHTPLHLPEFLGVEWYRLEADYEALMADCYSLLVHLAKTAETFPVLAWENLQTDLSQPPHHFSLHEVFATQSGVELEEVFSEQGEEAYFRLMLDKVEPWIATQGVVMLKDYPFQQALLAKPCPEKSGYHQRFEMYVCGVELANGWTEETDLAGLEARAREDACLRPERRFDAHYLQAAREGRLPPCAGVALGLERMIQVLLGEKDIAALSPLSKYLK